MNESIKNMIERRSVRGYKPDMIPKEDLDLILEAGTYAAHWYLSAVSKATLMRSMLSWTEAGAKTTRW